jgi:uncharacterized FlaG/YvyC family protein
MSLEAINTARIQSVMPGNMSAGTASRSSAPQSTAGTGADEKTQGRNGQQKGPDISQGFVDAVTQDMQAMHNVGIEFSVDHSTRETIVKVIDNDTGKLIRQIPPKEMVDLAAKLEDVMGILFDKQV